MFHNNNPLWPISHESRDAIKKVEVYLDVNILLNFKLNIFSVKI